LRHGVYMGALWHHLVNTTEPSMCGGDVALCQITSTTCFFYLSAVLLTFFCSVSRLEVIKGDQTWV